MAEMAEMAESQEEFVLKIKFDYHGNKRCTSVFIRQDDILKFSYDQFAGNIKREVPFIAKLGQL